MQKNDLTGKIVLFSEFLVSHPGEQNIEIHILTIRQLNLIVYKNTDEWHIEWPRVKTSDSEKRMPTSDTTSNSEREQLKKSDFKLQNETKGQSDSKRFLCHLICKGLVGKNTY